jgi:hypothetical protein
MKVNLASPVRHGAAAIVCEDVPIPHLYQIAIWT